MEKIKCLFFLLSVLILPINFSNAQEDFFIITLPKSGSHLLIKLINMLTGQYPNGMHELSKQLPNVNEELFEQTVLNCKQNNQYAFNHTGPYGQLFSQFSEKHPEYQKILQIRDLRDVLVSYTYHINRSLTEILGPEATFDDKLALVLNKGDSWISHDLAKNVEIAILWLQKPNVIVSKFEDLVGVLGGGDLNSQLDAITHLANRLDIELLPEQLEVIAKNLFGNNTGEHLSGTFRSGQIGSWKTHFKSQHLELFNQYWSEYHLQLGYSLD